MYDINWWTWRLHTELYKLPETLQQINNSERIHVPKMLEGWTNNFANTCIPEFTFTDLFNHLVGKEHFSPENLGQQIPYFETPISHDRVVFLQQVNQLTFCVIFLSLVLPVQNLGRKLTD